MLDADRRPKSPDQQGTGNEEKEDADKDAQPSHENIINLSGEYKIVGELIFQHRVHRAHTCACGPVQAEKNQGHGEKLCVLYTLRGE